MIKITFDLDESEFEKLKNLSDSKKISRSSIIRSALEKFFDEPIDNDLRKFIKQSVEQALKERGL